MLLSREGGRPCQNAPFNSTRPLSKHARHTRVRGGGGGGGGGGLCELLVSSQEQLPFAHRLACCTGVGRSGPLPPGASSSSRHKGKLLTPHCHSCPWERAARGVVVVVKESSSPVLFLLTPALADRPAPIPTPYTCGPLRWEAQREFSIGKHHRTRSSSELLTR